MRYNWMGWLLGMALLALGSCNNEENSIAQGTITGLDNRFCACCGGYLIIIDQFTYRFFESDLPAGNTTLDGATFPLEVELRFENESDFCTDIDRISIQEMKRK